MSRLFQIHEDDLAELEQTLPRIAQKLETEHMANATRSQLRRVKDILSNVRWDYGPPTDVEIVPAE